MVLPEQVAIAAARSLPGRILVPVGPLDERRTWAAQLVAHGSGGGGGGLRSPAHGAATASVHVPTTLQHRTKVLCKLDES